MKVQDILRKILLKMKQSLCIALLTCFSFTLFAQTPVVSKWTVKKFGISLAGEMEMPNNMDAEYLISTAHTDLTSIEETGFSAQTYAFSGRCENPNFKLNLTLLPPFMRNTELRLNLVGIFV